MFRAAFAAALILAATPAVARPLDQTHVKVDLPAGKTVPLYRPVNRNDCRIVRQHHQAGKTAHAALGRGDACATLAAKRDGNRGQSAN